MTVTVSTPSRLHFGLLRFRQANATSFGGLGMMIDKPRTVIQLAWDDRWSHSGPDSARAMAFAQHALAKNTANRRQDLDVALRVVVREAIPSHRGLGSGTQLALAVGAGVRALRGLPPCEAAELAASVGRGERSAVGSHGFVHGGLIWETGQQPRETLGQLTRRMEMPPTWRIVLITPSGHVGLSGADEREAFTALPPIPEATTARLQTLAEAHILPAAERGDVNDFGEGVYEYGRLSGQCFAALQGGAYASREIANCVATIRALGIRGVGQSSWGPTVYALLKNDEGANRLVSQLAEDDQTANHELQVVSPDNVGAVIQLQDESLTPPAASKQAVTDKRLS